MMIQPDRGSRALAGLVAQVAKWIHGSIVPIALLAALAGFTASQAFAWTKWDDADKWWTKGGTLNVYVEDPPAGAPAGTSAAVDEAIKEWNDAQAPFGGLKLVRQDTSSDDKKKEAKKTADIHISWTGATDSETNKKDAVDKTSNGFTKETVRVGIKTTGNSNAITRRLKHEIGHAEGLDHDARSALMRENAYSKTNAGPTLADLNSADPFISPTDDDKAGKKSMWGTTKKLSESEDASGAVFNGTNWVYDYNVHALDLPGLTDPVTEFSIQLLSGIGLGDFSVTGIPTGWHSAFFDGNIVPGGEFSDDGADPSPSVLSFLADLPSFGIQPGQTFNFELASPFAPGNTRAFTNSPSFDSDEFIIQAPSRAPEPSTLALLASALAGLVTTWRVRQSAVTI